MKSVIDFEPMSPRKVALVLLGLLMPMLMPGLAVGSELPQELRDLRDFYRGLESVYLKTKVEISIRAPLYEGHSAPVEGAGVIEHWENEQGFRTRASFDPRLQLVSNLDIAMSEGDFRIYDPAADLLAIEEPEHLVDGLVSVPLPTPNPLYLPALFLAPGDDACPACQMSLDYVSETSRWQAAHADMAVDEGASPSTAERFIGYREGDPYRMRIHFGPTKPPKPALARSVAPIGSRGIVRMERLRADGEVLATYVFSDFRPVNGAEGRLFPMRIQVAAHAPGEEPSRSTPVMTEYSIEALEINEPVARSALVVDPGKDTAVWSRGELLVAAE